MPCDSCGMGSGSHAVDCPRVANRYEGLTGDDLREAIRRDEEAAEARFVARARAKGEMSVTCRECGAGNVVSIRGFVDHTQDLLTLTDAIYGGVEKVPDDDPMWAPKTLRHIADWLDRVDDATESILPQKYEVGRGIQASLRDIAEGLDD